MNIEDAKPVPYVKGITRLFLAKANNSLDLYFEAAKQGNILQTRSRKKVYFINDPEAVRQIFVEKTDNYLKAGQSYDRLHHVLGPGLLVNVDNAWRERREQVAKLFHTKNLDQLTPILAEQSHKMLSRWNDAFYRNQHLDLMHEMAALVMQLSAVILFGKDISQQADHAAKRLRIANRYVSQSIFLHQPWIITPKKLQYYKTRNLINKLTEELLTPPFIFDDQISPLLSLFRLPKNCDKNDPLHHTLISEAKNFLIAGHETTATMLTWALFLLAQNPTVLEAAQDEVDKVLNGDRPTPTTLSKLPLINAILNETLRLYPAVWGIERQVVNDDVLCGYKIEGNTTAFVCPYTLHRNPDYWETPLSFFPWRFMSKDRSWPKHAFIPFGLGPRICIGKQLAMQIGMIVLTTIIQQFRWSLLPKQDFELEPSVTLKPKKPMKAWVMPR